MEYRKIGNTDLELSAITFGAWAVGGWMWGKANRHDAVSAIRSAFNEGVTSIDTAPIYGQGESEEIVGEAVSVFGRDKIQLLTKFGMRWNVKNGAFAFASADNTGAPIDIYKYAGKESIIKECEDSLRRLHTDYIDLYQIHWPDPTTPMSETFEAVDRLIEQGKIRYAGVCNYDEELLKEAGKHISLVSDQIPFSMVNRKIEKKTVPYCLKHGLSVLAYSPLERGLLTGKMTGDHHFAPGDHRAGHPSFTPENILKANEFLESIRSIAQEKEATLGQLVLRWTIDRPGITVALAGARNSQQAVANAHAVDIHLTEEERTFIDDSLNSYFPQ